MQFRGVPLFGIVAVWILWTGISKLGAGTPSGMVLVPAGKFEMRVEYRWREGLTLDTLVIDDAGIRYRTWSDVDIPAFYIDKTEVTNAQFKLFLDKTGYKPAWPENFLRHWTQGAIPAGKENHPVIWISLEDAQAYARWAGKRLPSEAEWQKAAQGNDGRVWPWGNLFDSSRANMDSPDTRPVGSYPLGMSPYGCLDMTGNVWEWTDSFATDGYHDFCWLRGGSFFLAKGSLWYMQGGPITNYQRVKFWLMTPALNRCATVGFRCVQSVR
ncbi:MAG TPA: SUMF1/EgtB/PvdO family nonheme iron enzyme [bacterium]|nr:SUMF1/EgtB/PvdO family nonheme iron enzyme [bacterium]